MRDELSCGQDSDVKSFGSELGKHKLAAARQDRANGVRAAKEQHRNAAPSAAVAPPLFAILEQLEQVDVCSSYLEAKNGMRPADIVSKSMKDFEGR